jgi:hypothetical protein
MSRVCKEYEREEVYMKGFTSDIRRGETTKETRLLRLNYIIVNLKEKRWRFGTN